MPSRQMWKTTQVRNFVGESLEERTQDISKRVRSSPWMGDPVTI
jgi:hypothetical protein